MTARQLWIVNHYAALPSKDGRYGRHVALAKGLSTRGWATSLFVASTTHPSGVQKMSGPRLFHCGEEDGIGAVWVRVPGYAGNGWRRILGMGIFALLVLRPATTANAPRPDAVVGSTVHPLAAWAGMRLARRHRVPFIHEIRDVWPETLIDLGKLSPNGFPARIMRRFSRHLCRRSSVVISPLPGVRSYLDDLGCGDVPFVWISNGVSVGTAVAKPSAPPSNFSFMYLGSVGNANGLVTLIDAFDLAWRRDESMRETELRIVGDGPLREAMRTHASTLESRNAIRFEDRIPKDLVPVRASEASCFVVNLSDLPVYRYGISLNKLFDYMLAGRPTIIGTNAVNNPVAESESGPSVGADDLEGLAAAMIDVRSMPWNERETLGDRGRHHVISRYDYAALAEVLAATLDRLVEEGHDAPS